ncbi:unnamed protein product [Penicillium manginii]
MVHEISDFSSRPSYNQEDHSFTAEQTYNWDTGSIHQNQESTDADQTTEPNYSTISTDETQKSETEVLKLSALRQRENTQNTRLLFPPSRNISSPILSEKDLLGPPPAKAYQARRRGLARGPSRFPEPSSLDNNRDMPNTIKANDHVNISDDLAAVENKVLRQQVDLLQAKLKRYESTEFKPPRFQFLYQLEEPDLSHDDDQNSEHGSSKSEFEKPITSFTDSPEIVYSQNGVAHLRCSTPLQNFDLFLALNPDISFLVFRHYKKKFKSSEVMKEEASRLPCPISESIYPVANEMKLALNAILESKAGFSDIKKRYGESGDLFAPYLFAYHSRQDIDEIKGQLSPVEIDHMNLFIRYLDEEYGEEYKDVDYLLERKLITPQYIHYLFKPGEILIEKVDDEYTGYVAKSWISKNLEESHSSHHSEIFDRILGIEPFFKPRTMCRFQIKAWNFKFDGHFFQNDKLLSFSLNNDALCIENDEPSKPQTYGNLMKTARPITDLDVFPLKYASQTTFDTLLRRGKTIWKCRSRSLVSYKAQESENSTEMGDERYMIDMDAYRKLHPEMSSLQYSGSKRLTEDEMAQDEPPDERFSFLFPEKIKGYNLRRKKWYEISLDRISDVEWNREAFHSLVIERSAKDMIQALVTNQIETEKSTDLIAGKGNGLILLLHGGPGTGKTLTAESVAEIAQKPLYRVTCGDVGTKAEDVEIYLESVLYLGRIWGCVVLLDEADIFLEQRSLEDLARNALVSVFLRVLEYYDGILILTSNRVGTFDEAFRSRIQLALHYPNLGPQQRFRIWQTFVDRLDSMGEDIDIADLRDNLHILKEEKLNGRQIRNVITTARQYAKWKGTTLTYEHLKEVIRVSGRFDDYLDKLNGGFSPDQIAQDDGVR